MVRSVQLGWIRPHGRSAVSDELALPSTQLLELLEPVPERRHAAYAKLRRDLVRFMEQHGCRDPDNAADEVVTRALTRLQTMTLEGDNAVRRYLFRIAKNIAFESWKRKPRREQQLDLTGPLEPSAPSREIAGLERRWQLESLLSQISGEEARTLQRYFATNDRKALAVELDVTPQHLRVLVHRTLNRLREISDIPRPGSP